MHRLQSRARSLYYGWYIVGAGAATNFLVIGVVTFSFGVFIGPMREELGWSVAAISFGVSLRSFESGLLAPVTGLFVDRLGPRRMAIAGVVITSAGLAMFSQASTLLVYYIASVVIALGQSLGSLTPFSAALMNWFERKRGRAMGLLNTGNGAGYLMAPVMAVLVTSFGWRETLLVASVVILVAGIAFALVLVDRPEQRGEYIDGDDAPSAATTAAGGPTGMSVSEGLRTPAFYLLSIATALSGAMIVTWIVHQVSHLREVGFSLESAALIGGVYGAVQIVIRPVVGWVGDRIGRRRLYGFAFLLQAIGLIFFAFLTDDRLWLLPFYYVTFAFGHAAWIVLQMTMVADYFGTRRFATLRGLGSSLQTPTGVIAPVLAGFVFDRTGSYQGIFIAYALVTAMGALAIWLIRRPTWSELQAAATSEEALRETQGESPAGIRRGTEPTATT